MNEKTTAQILTEYPFVSGYFTLNKLNVIGCESMTFLPFLEHFSPIELEGLVVDKEHLLADLPVFTRQMNDFLGLDTSSLVRSLTILSGYDKTGVPEDFESLTISNSQIISVVGPAGPGKDHLLADIEQVAQSDTLTERSVLINEEKSDNRWQFSSGNRLVARPSQNMSFVMDLTMQELLKLHAQSRPCDNTGTVITRIIEETNCLTGEQFCVDIPIISLSDGQPRTLTIADTATLSTSPIVLIDEIENVGIGRKKVLKLLMAEDKIVPMATRDPLLALAADRRIVIRNDGTHKVLPTSEQERQFLGELERMDAVAQDARHRLWDGQTLFVGDLK